MANFKYKVLNKRGETLDGTYTAETKEDVILMIRSNNYYPLKIEEIIESKKIEFKLFKKIKTKDIAIFCRQFYTMLNAGATISRCLSVLSQQIPNKLLRESIISVDENIRKGLTFSQALKKHPKVFPDLLVNMVETGEASGNLETIMRRMSDHYEKENKINNKIKSAMLYPIVLGFLCIGIIIFILVAVMPTFVGMYEGSGTELPVPTKIVLNISSVITKKWYYLIAALIAVGFGLKSYLTSSSGALFISKLKLSTPVIKSVNEKIIVSRFTRTLSTLSASGMSLVESLQIVGRVIGNKIVENKLLQVREQVIKGSGISEPLEQSKVFPIMLCSMVKIGEESGSLDDILNKTADFYDDELEAAIEQFTSMVQPVMILVMGSLIGFIIIAAVMPMFGMYDTIK